METSIIGRKTEKKILHDLLNSTKPEFLALYGRRRVGKTFLISEYFEGKGIFFELIGSKDSSNEVHIARFLSELSYKFYGGKEKPSADNWEACFGLLREAVDAAISRDPSGKIVIFFDELPWIDRNDPGFTASMDYHWNRYFSRSRYANLLLIVCGSAASWIIKRIISNKGGLHNRITRIIRLLPFNLCETQQYLESRGIILEKRHILETYMALGGIPFYLSLINNGDSSAQIINNLCFRKDGFLIDEFDRLFSSLFDKHETHLKIIHALASLKKGATRDEILGAAGLESGGEASIAIKELSEAGFILQVPAWKKRHKGKLYRLIDEYALFYLQWIEPVREQLILAETPDYWLKKSNLQSWKTWAGYAFEGICLKHIDKIKETLGISGVVTFENSWRHMPEKGVEERGAQIDLIIERSDRTINLCEIKFSTDIYRPSKNYLDILSRKKRLFKQITKTNYHIVTTMITTYGIEKTPGLPSAIDNFLTMDSLF
ncbi:MAG: hypothetical protein GF401_08570 [Chitinivibrionales bacterium]|nr:hypothetical protein [Chitinivibrionales bacterium]